ncbi:MAG: helix-turn-helix transcriptional regulator [Chitinophagales bacterium]|nr:helix-turn-helix transcriptional regulator [Chitinophagales bacterium]
MAYIYIVLRKTQTTLPIKEMNRIRVVLAELNKKNKWLADKLGKNQATVSQWCNNARQPSVETLFDIAEVLNIDVRKLLVSSKDEDN